MAIEQKRILFSFSETHALLMRHLAELTGSLPPKLDEYEIVDALHTRNLHKIGLVYNKVTQRMRPGILMAQKKGERHAVVFRVVHIVKNKEMFFTMPDEKLKPLLIKECMDRGITLPRKGNKAVVAEDLYVGLWLDIEKEIGLDLED